MTCSGDELETIFGEVRYYFTELTDLNQLSRVHFAENKLIEVKLTLEF